MKIVVTGGGSGGHITPILAVARELKQQQPQAEITYIGQVGDSLGDVPAQDPNIDFVKTVRAGKLRRYHGEGVWQLLDLPTVFKNIRDVFMTLMGIFQCLVLLRQIRPDVIFIKGGFVGVPVGLAAAFWRIPYVTHDSDAIPGLANRIIAPWARYHAVALPKEVYQYPPAKTLSLGVPISREYRVFDAKHSRTVKDQLGLDTFDKILLVTGGGLGALRINNAVLSCADDLLDRYPDMAIVHIAGRANEQSLKASYVQHAGAQKAKRVFVKGFVNNLYNYSGVADVVITRAGGTTMAELAAQQKPCIVIPNPLLTGGHQIKNANVLADRKAIRLVSEKHLQEDHLALMSPLVALLDNPSAARQMGKKLGDIEHSDAAYKVSMLLLDIADKNK